MVSYFEIDHSDKFYNSHREIELIKEYIIKKNANILRGRSVKFLY